MNMRSISFRWSPGMPVCSPGFFCCSARCCISICGIFWKKTCAESQARRTRQIANTLLVHVKQTGEPYVASQTKDWYEPEINDRFIRITRADGTLVYVSGTPNDGSFDPAEVPVFPPAAETESYRKLKLSGGKTLLVAALNFKSAGNPAYLVEFGELLDPVETMLNRLFLQLAWGFPLAVIIIAGGGYLLVRRALTPVEQITRAAERITQHNLSERLPVSQHRR
jgi:hypothetical protein